MRILTLRASAMAFAAALAGAVGCGSGGCSGTNPNANSNTPSAPTEQCGQGTYLNSANQCVPRPSSNNSTSAPSTVQHL